MDIPQMMVRYSDSQSESSSLLSTLIKQVPIKKNDETKNLFNVFMDFNLDKKAIEFHVIPYGNQSEEKYNYFGNNPAAAKQVFVVRDVGSLMNYWTGRPSGVMKNVLDFLEDGELKKLLNECFENEMFDENGINFQYIQYSSIKESEPVCLKEDKSGKKALYFKNDRITPEKFISMCIDDSPNSKFVLIIPRVIKNNKKIVISTHMEYINAIEQSMQGKNEGTQGICHICGLKKNDINTKEYSSKFSKSSIGKVFVTTTVNYAPLFDRKGHQSNYGICKSCYEKFLFGEKRVMNDFKLRIANEDCVLLFEGIDHAIDIEYIDELKQGIDVVFNPKDTKEWVESFKKELEKSQNVLVYQFNMIFYKTDGKSCAIKKTIEDISNIRFDYIKSVFENVRRTYGELLLHFTLGHIYTIVPVSVSKDGKQLSIQRVLDLYSAIMKGGMVERNFIFDLATEALERGIRQFNSSQVRNYKNLYNLVYLSTKEYGKDVFIRQIMMSYMALFQILQELKILDKEVFHVEENKIIPEDLCDEIRKCEEFTNTHGFSREAKGLFYLGFLLNKIAYAQYKQGHKDKPILDKISYGGMSNTDVITLYLDALEKVRQYKKHLNIWICEQIEKQFHLNMGNLEKTKLFSEKENVFFIMSGYAFGVNVYKGENNLENKEEEKND